MTDKEFSNVVYAYSDNGVGSVVAGLLLSHAGLYTGAIFYTKEGDMPSDIPVVAISEYYKDAALILHDIAEKVNQGKMHQRAIAIAMDLLL